jgi:hypothetical protein
MPNARYETELFAEQLEELRQDDHRAAEQVDKITARLVANPGLNDGQLKGPLAGHFKKKAVERKYRLVFRYCKWCLAVKKEKCADCATRPDDSVVLEQLFPRKDGYDN